MLPNESFLRKGKLLATTLAIAICVLLTPILLFSNFTYYFHARFTALNVYQSFSDADRSSLDQKFEEILDYMNGRIAKLDSDFYSERDILHMQDVRNLNLGAIIVSSVCSSWIIFVLFKKDKENLIDAMHYSGTGLLALFASVLAAIAVSFDAIFIKFHQILFSNDYWQLDPESSNLIKFLPSQIFNEIFIIVSLSIIITGLILVFLSKQIKNHAG